MTTSIITGKATIAEWLAHPSGGPVLRGLLAQGGQDEAALAPVQNLPLQTLVSMSGGRFPQQLVDAAVAQANPGVSADELAAADAPSAPHAARFEGRTVIVTGAASGIGRATALRIAAEGGRVIGVDVARERLEATAAEVADGALVPVVADITDEAGIASILAAAEGRVHGLANVAGVMDGMLPLHEVTDAVWERVFRVNVEGIFKLSRAVLPAMLEAGAGAIVNVASEAALRGNAAGTAYTASKHAVVGITKSAAFLYGRSGIRVNAVAPGPVATGIEGDFQSEFSKSRLGPFLQMIPPVAVPEQIA
ncbi:MAG TPA: SDR family oxidoreductase, partial [Microbacterium sp.]|nr:SDR family oxidoreductase [Microbacterium sp.]